MVLRRGFSVVPGERIVVVEDVVTTGGSTRGNGCSPRRPLARRYWERPQSIDRSLGKADVGVPRVALATLDVASVDAANCELCQRGEVASKPGSRKNVTAKSPREDIRLRVCLFYLLAFSAPWRLAPMHELLSSPFNTTGQIFMVGRCRMDCEPCRANLTKALSLIEGRDVVLHGSGRTDAGVHAEGQVASVHLQRTISAEKLRSAINGNVGKDVRVLEAEVVDDEFHARYSALEKPTFTGS